MRSQLPSNPKLEHAVILPLGTNMNLGVRLTWGLILAQFHICCVTVGKLHLPDGPFLHLEHRNSITPSAWLRNLKICER